MSKVDLGGSINDKKEPQKTKVIYMNIQTTVMLMLDIMIYPNCKKYVDALSTSIKSSLSKKELRKEIFKMFGVKTMKKMTRTRIKEIALLSSIFGEDIWGE